MYRVLLPKHLQFWNLHSAFKSNFWTTPPCLSKHDYRHVVGTSKMISRSLIRLQSTNVNSALQKRAIRMKKKKYRSPKKKYAELVEVTDDSLNQTKATVTKLKSKYLSMLVQQPNINLGQLHNLKKGAMQGTNVIAENAGVSSHTEHRLQTSSLDTAEQPQKLDVEIQQENMLVMEELGAFNNSMNELIQDTELENFTLNSKTKLLDDIHREISVESGAYRYQPAIGNIDSEHLEFDDESLETMAAVVPSAVEAPKHTTLVKPKTKGPAYKANLKKKVREELAKVKRMDLERAAKEESLFRNLRAYFDVCVSCGLLNRGLSSLLFYHSRNNEKFSKPAKQIHLFNIFLRGFAGKGNISKIKEILEVLHRSKLHLNIQSYAGILECIGRLSDMDSHHEFLMQIVQQMAEQGYTFNDLFTKNVFISDQKEKVLAAVHVIEPSFEPIIPEPDIHYCCSILNRLNDNADSAEFKSPARGLMNRTKLLLLTQEQLDMELNSYVRVKTIEKRPEPSETELYYRKKLLEAEHSWRDAILKAYHRNLKALRAQHHYRTFRNISLHPYLKVLNPEDYAEIIMQEIRKLAEGSETYSPTTQHLYRELGLKVQARYEVKTKNENGILKKTEELYEKYCDWYLNPEKSLKPCSNTRQKWQQLVYDHQEGPTLDSEGKMWPGTILSGVGRFLYNIIMQDIKIDVNLTRPHSKTQHFLPAFYTLFRCQGRQMKEEVKPHPVLSRLFRGAAQETLVFEVTNVPMLCPPVPWTSITSGGYLVDRVELIRLPQQAVQQWHRLKGTPIQHLYPSLDALSQLGSIPWKVNEQMLDVVIEVFNSGGSHRLDIPESPSSCPQPAPVTQEMGKAERLQAYRQRLIYRRRKAEMYSLWCDALYRLSLANHFRKKIFWLPHNMDFRGRVYPCPPHLNHLGSDMARSLLCFANGELLGSKGLDWLKIHLINLTGTKKRDSLAERLAYADEMMPQIFDSAKNPLTGKMWWAESEEPWQTLACCMEVVAAIESGDPENFVSHFPVHQDGSCNGLQHYAALGRDRAGGESVNLTPAERPQDVYSCVAVLVERERAKDAANGVKIANVLEGFVRRKVIKQTVMTTVYGVTRFGARLQIARQLKDLDDYPKDQVWQGSTYLVSKTFESLQEMFTSTKQIQDWFTDCARLIAQVCGQSVEWVTPLGLPIVQPYSRAKPEAYTSSAKLREHHVLDMFERPNVMKQKNAFPPNFIHSLDSSHMMLTSLFCERKGITFVSVHDCFWTHAPSVEIMNRVCREQFVALHSEPILEDLSEFLVEKYGYSEREFANDGSVLDNTKRKLNRILTCVPPKGDLQLETVLDSVYFFS